MMAKIIPMMTETAAILLREMMIHTIRVLRVDMEDTAVMEDVAEVEARPKSARYLLPGWPPPVAVASTLRMVLRVIFANSKAARIVVMNVRYN